MLSLTELPKYLKEQGLISSEACEVSSLTGGVSSEVVVVRTAGEQFVVKQALPQLKVRDEWLSDPRRNLIEYQALQFAAEFLADAVPRVFHVDEARHLFVMEYLGSEYKNWKQQLMRGVVDYSLGEKVGHLLATLHNRTWNNLQVAEKFATWDSFFQLRIEPYLLTTATRHPDVSEHYLAEVERLQHAQQALVHGDFSAKNLLVSPERLVLLDWEVAWYGAPAFDAAFLLNLLYLGSLYRRQEAAKFIKLIDTIRHCYAAGMKHFTPELDRHICRLILLLWLARIDGKSPVEYISAEQDRDLVRGFVKRMLQQSVVELEEVNTAWLTELNAQ